jgi:hypothetical protein
MNKKIAPVILLALAVVATRAWPQETDAASEAERGHYLATLICSNCHFATPDQTFAPILRPPAPTFASIVQRLDDGAIATFIASTHRDVSNPEGMPNPQLLDFQVRQITAYMASLRNSAADGTGPCGAQIAGLEMALKQARTTHIAVGGATESTAARLHRQPTPDSVARAAMESERNVEAALTEACTLGSQGKEAQCREAAKKAALFLGLR